MLLHHDGKLRILKVFIWDYPDIAPFFVSRYAAIMVRQKPSVVRLDH